MRREELAQREGPSVGLHRLVRHVLTGVVRLVAHELVDARLHLGRHAGEGEATPGRRRAAERAARGGTAEASSTPRHQGISPRTVGFGAGASRSASSARRAAAARSSAARARSAASVSSR